MPPVECVIKFIPATRLQKKEISFPSLYNLKLDMLENKKKLAKILPPYPSWAKTKPPPPEVQKTAKKALVKKPEVKKKEERKEVNKEKDLSVKKKPKKIEESLEESEEEDSGEEESEEEESEEEESGEEEEEDSNSLEESTSEVETPPVKTLEVMSDAEKLKNGYVENLTPEEKERREKDTLLRKYKLLQYRLRQKYDRQPDKRLKEKMDGMISLGQEDALDVIRDAYEKEVFELKVISNTQRYKQLLFMGFAATEAVASQFTPALEGYSKFQLSNADEYEDLLMELGGDGDGFIENMSPFSKLLWAISMNTVSFVVAKNLGPNASDFISLATGRKAEPVSAPKIHLD